MKNLGIFLNRKPTQVTIFSNATKELTYMFLADDTHMYRIKPALLSPFAEYAKF